MKIIINTFRDNDRNIISLNFSKSFISEIKKQIEGQLSLVLGEIFDKNDIILIINYLPINIKQGFITKAIDVSLMYYNCYSFLCNLCWKYKTETAYIDVTKVLDEKVEIWLEILIGNVDFEYLKNDLVKYAYLKRKTILIDYRFPVIIKKPNLDCYFKLNFKNVIEENESINIEHNLGKHISIYNENSQKVKENFIGLIHSFYSEKSKIKNQLLFKLDLGSAGDFGLKYLFSEFDKSDLEILKIEVEGI